MPCLVVLLKEGGGIAEDPWLCSRKEGVLQRSHGCGARGRRNCQGPMDVLWEGEGTAEVPWLGCRREEVLPRSPGCAA